MKEKASILIVDDDPGMTETLGDILRAFGYDVEVAGEGYRAVEMIKERAYDIIFMDIKMPGINGVETLKEVKRLSPSTKVIMMTAYSVEDLVKEVLDEAAYGIIYKPLDMNKVIALVEEISRQKREGILRNPINGGK